MPQVKTRGGLAKKHEPYPLNKFPASLIQSICKRMVHLRAVGHADMTGEQFDRIFSDAIDGHSFSKPVGLADVAWNGCSWSVKTIKHESPFRARSVRLIVGRNSPNFAAGISDHYADIARTGEVVLEIYNERIEKAEWDHSDTRRIVLVRNFTAWEFVLYERPIARFIAADYEWRKNKNGNLEGFEGDRHAFTWQPHGGQFTIIEDIPASATRFRVNGEPSILKMEPVLRLSGFKPDWVEILKE